MHRDRNSVVGTSLPCFLLFFQVVARPQHQKRDTVTGKEWLPAGRTFRLVCDQWMVRGQRPHLSQVVYWHVRTLRTRRGFGRQPGYPAWRDRWESNPRNRSSCPAHCRYATVFWRLSLVQRANMLVWTWEWSRASESNRLGEVQAPWPRRGLHTAKACSCDTHS